jgi:hypothetical protein
LCGDLGHEVANNRANGVAGGPDEKAVWNLFHLLFAVWACGLGFDVFVEDVVDHRLGADCDLLFVERSFCVIDELL